MSSEDINDYERTIERLTILFSKGEISEESYMKAIKAIEEKIKLGKKTVECPDCGKEFHGDLKLCPNCGWSPTPPSYTPYRKKPPGLWYFVPLLLTIAGGLIAYYLVKDEDKEMAETLLGIGILMTIINILLAWAILARTLP